jgi:hypothetical protein
MNNTLLTTPNSNDLTKENIKVEEAQLIVSAITELHRNCLIDTFKKPYEMKTETHSDKMTNGIKFVNFVEFCKPSSKVTVKDEKISHIEMNGGEKINIYIDEEIILEVSEYSMNLKKCNICLQKFNTSISTHFNEHKLEKKFCILCNQEFNYKIQLNTHKCALIDFNEPLIRNLSNNIFYSCKLCCSNRNDENCENFSTFDIYCNHVKTFHQSILNCMFCEHKFNSANLYIHHLKFEHLFTNLVCVCETCCSQNIKVEAI